MPHPSASRSSTAGPPAGRSSRRRAWAAAVVLAGATVAAMLVLGTGVFERDGTDRAVVDERVERVLVEIDRGRLTVTEGGDDGVVVERAWRRRFATPELSVAAHDDGVVVASRCASALVAVDRCRVDLRVVVPVGASVEVRSGRGAVVIDEVSGDLTVVSGGGRVRGLALGGDEVIVSSGGAVDLAVSGGPFDVQVSSSGAPVEVAVPVRGFAEPTLTVASDGGRVSITPWPPPDGEDGTR
jgi:hypothetical protein